MVPENMEALVMMKCRRVSMTAPPSAQSRIALKTNPLLGSLALVDKCPARHVSVRVTSVTADNCAQGVESCGKIPISHNGKKNVTRGFYPGFGR
jgi:hypothetical protein